MQHARLVDIPVPGHQVQHRKRLCNGVSAYSICSVANLMLAVLRFSVGPGTLPSCPSLSTAPHMCRIIATFQNTHAHTHTSIQCVLNYGTLRKCHPSRLFTRDGGSRSICNHFRGEMKSHSERTHASTHAVKASLAHTRDTPCKRIFVCIAPTCSGYAKLVFAGKRMSKPHDGRHQRDMRTK